MIPLIENGVPVPFVASFTTASQVAPLSTSEPLTSAMFVSVVVLLSICSPSAKPAVSIVP